MNQSAITHANRNILNQTIKRLASQDTKGMMKVSFAWYEKVGETDDGKPIWEPREAQYDENWEKYQENIEKFEETMKTLHEQGLATQRKGKTECRDYSPRRNKQHSTRSTSCKTARSILFT